MGSKTIDMFGGRTRKSARTMMHMTDCGVSDFVDGHQCVKFKCKKCGNESGWLHGFKTVTEVKRGIPCDKCKKKDQMTDLRIAVKGEFFNLTKEGKKPWEFRDMSDYWIKRLVDREYDTVTLTLGYPKKGDGERIMTFKYNGYIRVRSTILGRNIFDNIFNSEDKIVFAINVSERIK